MPNNIIDSIQLSGVTYGIKGSGGTETIELTQAQYDALVDKDPNVFYIITDAQAGDLTNYYTKTETNTLLGGKQDTLVSGTNIKTINNESILGSGNIDIQGGSTYTAGRGISIANDTISFDLPIYKTVSGTAHSLVLNTSSEPSANTFKTKYNTYINCTSPYVADNSGTKNLIMGDACSAMSYANDSFVGGYGSKIGDIRTFAFGGRSEALAVGAVAFGYDGQSFKPQVSKGYGSFACGGGTSANTYYSFATGYHTFTTSRSEFASGQYNNSVSASTTFGDGGNTLFSVGNGTADNARHNAFEIRQNGDIYITLNGQDVKLQDKLGGGGSSYTAGDGIDITNDVISVTGKVDTTTYNTYTAATDTALASKADTATTYTKTEVDTALSGYVTRDTLQDITAQKTFVGDPTNKKKSIKFKQYDDASKVGFVMVNSAETNNEIASFEFRPNTFTIDNVQHPLLYFGHYRNTNIANAGVPQTVIGFRQYDQKNAAAYHYLIPLPEKAKTAFSLTTSFKDFYAPMGFKNGSTMITADNTGVVDLSSELGGLKLVKLTQTEYDALATKDSNTLYVIVN